MNEITLLYLLQRDADFGVGYIKRKSGAIPVKPRSSIIVLLAHQKEFEIWFRYVTKLFDRYLRDHETQFIYHIITPQ